MINVMFELPVALLCCQNAVVITVKTSVNLYPSCVGNGLTD